MSVPTSDPEYSKREIASTALSDAIQDTNSVEQLRIVCNQSIIEATADNHLSPTPLSLPVTIGTQTE